MKKTFVSIIIVVSIGVFSGLSLAGGGRPTKEKCEEKGMIDVTCIICSTGQKTGMISVKSAYDPAYEDCMLYWREALKKCANVYGTSPSSTGIKWEYWIGATRYYGHAPSGCGTSPKAYPGAGAQVGGTGGTPQSGSKFSGKD